ncbi:hypothetical protein BDV95DRAFT_380856 [Massariosphaeria phaeospora]|uniref:Uncharacterized protein n=1 Tax=Massariosphaeria phaeospora TaxID=100035 RepID=A0A7C8M9D0_9PLEO|nr:hypothetical protein BDV95DRAFT_380856 [Massariosphaeria phaeospora]
MEAPRQSQTLGAARLQCGGRGLGGDEVRDVHEHAWGIIVAAAVQLGGLLSVPASSHRSHRSRGPARAGVCHPAVAHRTAPTSISLHRHRSPSPSLRPCPQESLMSVAAWLKLTAPAPGSFALGATSARPSSARGSTGARSESRSADATLVSAPMRPRGSSILLAPVRPAWCAAVGSVRAPLQRDFYAPCTNHVLRSHYGVPVKAYDTGHGGTPDDGELVAGARLQPAPHGTWTTTPTFCCVVTCPAVDEVVIRLRSLVECTIDARQPSPRIAAARARDP